jgi:hypothetical protein
MPPCLKARGNGLSSFHDSLGEIGVYGEALSRLDAVKRQSNFALGGYGFHFFCGWRPRALCGRPSARRMSADAVTVDAAAVESVDALKTRGNGLFSKGDSAGAIVVYGEALAQLGETPRKGELAGSLLQNRALCKKKCADCIADCDEALATAVRPKALYRTVLSI